MNKSYLIASVVALATVGWIASGQFSEGEVTPVEDMTTATGTAASEKEILPKVRTRHTVAQEHISSLLLFGRTEGVRSVQVKVETAGRIASVPAQKGQAVKKRRCHCPDRLGRPPRPPERGGGLGQALRDCF